MPTINSRDTIDKIVAKNGQYHPDDPLIVKIVRYINMGGEVTYGVIYVGYPLDYYKETEYIRKPTTFWEHSSIKQPTEEEVMEALYAEGCTCNKNKCTNPGGCEGDCGCFVCCK